MFFPGINDFLLVVSKSFLDSSKTAGFNLAFFLAKNKFFIN